MLYEEIETVQAIRWIDSWFWKRLKEEKEFSVERLSRLFEVPESFVEDVISKKIHPDVKGVCMFPSMQQAVHQADCLKHTSELPEELLWEPSPAVLELMEIEEELNGGKDE